MEYSNFTKIARLIWSWGFGAQIGAGLLSIIYLLFPSIFLGIVPLETFSALPVLMLIGGLLGAGIHGLLNKITNLISGISTQKKQPSLKQTVENLKLIYENKAELSPKAFNRLEDCELKRFEYFSLPPQIPDEQRQLEGEENINTKDE